MFERGTIELRKIQSLATITMVAAFGLLSAAQTSAQSTVSPTTLAFGNVALNQTSAAKTVTFKNTATTGSITVSAPSVTAGSPYNITGNTCPGSLAHGASCTISVDVKPTATGAVPAASLTVTSGSPDSPQTVALTATGVEPSALSASMIAFGNAAINETSASKTITLDNYQLTSLGTISFSVTSPYAVVSGGTCVNGGSLAASSSCTILVDVKPTATGAPANVGTLTVNTGTPNSPLSASLTATGVEPAALSAPSVAFGNVAINETSASKTITLDNYQLTALGTISFSVPSPYAVSGGTCVNGGSLAASSSCTITIDVKPAATGAVTLIPAAALTVNTGTPNSPLSATLTATGVEPAALSASSIAFGNAAINETSASKTITLDNYQLTSLGTISFSVTSPYAVSGGTCVNGGSLAASSSCTITIDVKPTATGAVTLIPAAALTVNTGTPNSPLSASLTATGVEPAALSAPSVAFGNVAINETSASKTITLDNYQLTALGTISFSVPSPYAVSGGTCVNGGSLAASSSCTITIDVKPAATGAVTLIPAAALTVNTGTPNSPLSATLTATGVEPAALSASSIAFGNAAINETSASKTITLDNYQLTSLGTISFSVTSPYAVVSGGTCVNGGSLAASSSCTILVDVRPTATGAPANVGTLTVNTGTPNSPLSASLTATGVEPAALSAPSVAFGNVAINETSASKTITLDNYQLTALGTISFSVPSPYAVSGGTCVNGGSLAASSSCTITIDVKPAATGAVTLIPAAALTVNTGTPNSPLSATLTATGVEPAALSASSIAFGNAAINETSASKTITLDNYQLTALGTISFSVPSPYAVSGGTCVNGGSLAASSSCTITIDVKPAATGAVTLIPAAALTVNTGTPNSPLSATLTATGVEPAALSASSIAFGNVVVGETSASKTITLDNYQLTALGTISFSVTSPYAVVSGGTCVNGGSLAASSSCTILVDVTPTALGAPANVGTLTVNTGTPNSPLSAALSTTGIGPVALSPASISFPATSVGVTSAVKAVTLTNEQNIPLIINSANITGADPADFAIASTTCPTTPQSLPAAPTGNTCTINVSFKPTASGSRTATLSIADNAGNSPQTVSLTGSGNAPVAISPDTTQTFTANVGSTSAYRTFTITNEQTTTGLHISNFQLTGPFIQTATTCPMAPAALGGGGTIASCTLAVEFNPTVGGVSDGQLQVQDDVVTSPQVVNLTGTGTNPLTILPTSLSFSAQMVGTVSASKPITLTNHESQQESFTLTPSAEYTANSNCATGVIAANSTCSIFVDFAPTSVPTGSAVTGTLTIADTAAVGSPIVASLTGSATASNPAAAVAVVSPGAGSGAVGTMIPVSITGNGWTHFTASSVITFTDTDSSAIASDIEIVPGSQVLIGPNQINATLEIMPPAGQDVVFGARNIKVVTPLPTTPVTNETASLDSAFIVTDPTQVYTITNVTPAFGIQGQTLNVSITASGTTFQQGVTYANFGDGITVNSLTITDPSDPNPNQATANITISNTTPVGYRTITMVTGGQSAVSVLTPQGNPIFQIGPNSATLTGLTLYQSGACSANPVVLPQSGTSEICITATGTHFLQSATQLALTNFVVGAVNVTSPTTATASVTASASATGEQVATVSTGGEIATLSNAALITGATPGLISVSPSSGAQGQQNINVVITGNAYTAFNACPGGVLLADFTGEITTNSVTANSASQVTANISISQYANVGTITANLTCGAAGEATIFPFGFTITPSGAEITSVVPNNVAQGAQVTLAVTGLNTSWAQATTTAAFYPEPIATPSVDKITVIDTTSATLNISVPTNTPVGSYPFYMATGGQVVSASINVYANTPTLSMNPSNGLVPSNSTPNAFTVNFTGQFTSWTQAATVPVIAGEGVTLSGFTVTSPSSATATLTIAPGAATGLRLVTFTTGGQIVTTYFNVTTIPVGIISVSPNNGPQNATLNVAIKGLNTHFASGVTTVQFGPQITVNSVTVTDATDLVANITTNYLLSGVTTATPPGWQQVYINTSAEQVLTSFLVDAPQSPSIVSVCLTAQLPSCVSSAAQGTGGLEVTITGSLTNWVQGTSELILGNGITVSNLSISSPTLATATISVDPTAPVGGNSVLMYTGTEIDSGADFSVTPSAAYITSVEPNFTCPANYVNDIAGFNCQPGSAPTGVPVIGQLQTATLNIVGIGTHWLQGYTVMNFGPGVNVDQLTVNSPTTAQVQITVLSSAPVGFVTLTANTGGEAASLQQAIDIEDESPILLAITPSSGQQAATLTINVLGRATHFTQGVTQVTFNNPDLSLVPGSIVVTDSEDLSVGVTVSPWAYVDYSSPCSHELIVTTGSEQVNTAAIQDNFCVTQGAEQINSVSPQTTPQGSSLPITITGSATNFVAGETTVSFGDPNFAVGEISVSSPTSLTASVAVSTAAQNGFKNITVTTLGQVATGEYEFTVTPSVATLNEAIPNQAEQGAPLPSATGPLVIRLLGQYSHFSSESTATFGAGITVDSVQYVSATEVDATITIDPLSYVGGRTVTVATPGVSCADQPSVVAPGANDITGVSYQGCTLGSPVGTGKEIVTANIFTIIQGPAIITGISPNTGNEGQEVVANITGSGTHWAQNFTQFYIAGGGSDITINSVVVNSATSATVDMSISPTANPGARSIFMTTNGESLTDTGAFVVTGGIPVISYLTPNNALQGTNGLEVTVVGNAYTQWTTGVSTVAFGPGVTVESYQVDDTSHIEAVIDVGPACTSPGVPANCAQTGYRTVVVQTGTQGLTGNFLVTAPAPPPTPYIWYENPSSGIPGQTLNVTFYGAYTQWNPGTGPACGQTGTTLTGFDTNVTVNCFQVLSPTSATANITINSTAPAFTYDLTLTTTGTTNNPSTEVDHTGFSVVVAQPTLSVVDPGSAIQGAQDVTVNIIGQFTAFDATTTFTFGNGIVVNGAPTILGPTIATQSISIPQLQPTGGYAVVSNTPDATSANQVTVGGAGFSVTPSLASILSIAPNTAQQGQSINVAVTGQDTHWNGGTTFQFGDGITVSNVDVTSETTATLTVTVPAYAGEGPTGATAITGGEVASIINGFVVQAGTPYLLSSGPGSLPQQSSAIFTILSQATTWSNANPPTVSYGAGVVLTNVNVTTPTSLTVDGYVQPTTLVGYRTLTVSTGTQVLTLPNAFYVTNGPAVINDVTPNTAGQGATLNVVISGTNTNWQQGVTQLSFPNVVVNTMTVVNATTIDANITVNDTAPAGEESLTATTGGEVANGFNVFTVTQTQPELLAVVLNNGVQGLTESTVNLTGEYTSWVNGSTTANFGTGITVNSVTVTSPTAAQANITISPTTTLGYRNVSVSVGTQTVTLDNAFQVIQGPAEIAGSLNPASGSQGNSYSVQITGSQTHFAQGVTTASFGGGIQVTGITVNSLLSATVNITIPNGTALGAYNVVLTTGGEVATILGGFTVTNGSPQISVVNPPTGDQGATNLNVTLTGLYTDFFTGAGCSPNCSQANFGSGITVNSTTASSATSAVANITISPTATLGSRNVSVTTGTETASITGGFSVLAGQPQLLTALPASGQAGTTVNVVITGEFVTFQQGFTSVSFGDNITTNLVTVNSTTQLTANISIPSNASVETASLSETTNGVTASLSSGFSVTAGTPVITTINPNYGNPGNTNLTVTIDGQYTNWTTASTVTIGTIADGISVGGAAAGSPGPVVSATATSVTVSISIAAGAPVGPAEVYVTTSGSTQEVPGGFTVQAASVPAPSLIMISPGPNYGSTGVGGTIPINTNFIGVFSEPMNRSTINTSTVLLTLTSNPNGNVTVPGTVTLDATGRIVTFTPNSLLAVNSQYYLNLTGSIQGASGVAFSNYGVYLYTEDSANTTPATVVAANPPANATNVGTNVLPQLEFSTDMNLDTETGMTVSTGGNPIAGTWSWNSYPYGSPYWGPGNLLTFTPTAPLAANTTYTVSYGSPLADTVGNALTPGSFTFTTGSGPDTTTNNSGSAFPSGITNVATNFVPVMNFSKPINPIDINSSTLLLYNSDSGKYIQGTVTVAPNGLSATFTPTFSLLPDTYYRLTQNYGYYDMDGNYLNGVTDYFTTGAGEDTTPPSVINVSPVNGATSMPLNTEVIIEFNAPVNPDTLNNSTFTLTPSGGSPVAGTVSLASDMVTLTFVPTPSASAPDGSLQPSTVYTINVSGYSDVNGNPGTSFSSTFTTAASQAPVVVSTGLNAAGDLITTGNTPDAHWMVIPTASIPSETTWQVSGTPQPLLVSAPGDTCFYTGTNGPDSSWVQINPSSSSCANNMNGVYYTNFNLTGSLSNLCLVGSMGTGFDYGLLMINGNPIMSQIYSDWGLTPLNIAIPPADLVAGQNTLTLGWNASDTYWAAFRLQASIETCGASTGGALSLTSAVPANNATNIATNTSITLTFNNALVPSSVNSTTLPVMVGWNSNQELEGNYVVTGNQVVFTPDTPFPINTQIYVGAYNGPYDLGGDSADTAGANQYYQLTYFTTGSTATPAGTPFQVSVISPASNSTNVGLRAPAGATFNRSLDLSTVNTSDFALFSGDGQSPWCSGGNYSHSQDDTTILFTCGVMPSSTVMTEYLSSGLTDWQGNGLTPSPTINKFTTSAYDSNTYGSVITSRPGNSASGIATTEPLTLFFNLPVNASTVNSGIEVAQNNANVPGSISVQDNGYTAVFTPSVAWTPGALIQWWTTGTLLDTTYNTPISEASGYFYIAASTTTAAPSVQVFSPGNGTTVGTNGFVDLQFNTPLNPATVCNGGACSPSFTGASTTIYIYDTRNGNHINAVYTMPQANEVRIVPTSALNTSDTYYVYITTGVQSTTSVPIASTIVDVFYTGTGLDSTLPTLVSAVPYNGATNVGINVAPGFVLSKTVDPASVNSTTFQVTNGGTPLPGTFYLSSSDTRVQFVPNDALPPSTNLVMTLNGVLDLVGNPINYSSNFQTGPGPDFTAPTVVWTSIPSSGSIPINSAITIDFSESMDVTTFSAGASGDIYIYDTLLGTRVPATLSWNATQTVAYLLPSSPLSPDREYYFYVTTGTDLAGNEVNGIGITFYAEAGSATTAPTVINLNPLNGATGVGTNVILEAQFSAPIDPTTLSGVGLSGGVQVTPVMSAANTIVQLVPSAPLAPNTTYTMTIAGVKDPAGNAVATTTDTFTTGATYDLTPPVVVSTDPPSNATVGTNVTPKFVFNKPLNPLEVNASYFALYLNDTGQYVPITVSLSANAEEVTLTPEFPLLPNTEYRFSNVNGGGAVDEDGNFDNLPWYYFYTGAGAVTTGPTVSVSPLNSATGVPLNAQVIVNVSAPIDETTVNQNSIQLLKGATPVSGTVSLVSDQEITFTPAGSLSASTTYTVKVSGFTDVNGNALTPATTTTTFTTGSAVSTGGLTYTGANINNGATVTSSTQQIVLTFSQILDATTVNSTTLEVMDTWNSNRGLAGTYAVSGNQVTFTPAEPYPAGAQITVGECGGPTDILGDVFQGGNCYSQELLYFNAPGTSVGAPTSLTVLSVSPANGATNVGRDQSVSVTFSNPINNGTAGGTNTQLYAGQSLQTDGNVLWSADGRTMTFNIGALNNGTTYTVAIPAGGVTDEWGNTLTSTYTSTFTTEADPATGNGSVQAANPATNASGIPTDTLLTLYMNRQVDAATVPNSVVVTVNGVAYPGTLQSVADNYEIQYTPTTPFPAGATVQWFLSGVYDINGDLFNSTNGYFYIAAAVNPSTAQPTIVAVSPSCCNSDDVPTNGEIDIQYSLPIKASTLSGNVYLYSGPSTPTFTVGLVSGTNNVVRITPTSPWTASTQYGFCTNGSVLGTNGVAAASSCYLTYFTTTTGPDTTPGTVTIGPPNGVVGVGTNAYIRLQFSKPADRTTVNSTNVQITTGGNPIPGTWSYSYNGADLYGADFSPVNPLPPSTQISVSESGIQDYAGNTFASASSSFTTAALPDYTTPSVSLNFGYGQTGIGTNASFTCLYTEAMDPSSVNNSNTYLYSYVTNAHVPLTYTWASDLMSVTMTPTSPLLADSEYYYYCQSAIDLTGNAQNNNSAVFYTANGPVASGPVLLEANPPSGMTNVPVNSYGGPWNNTALMLSFNEPVSSDSMANITFTPHGGSAEPIVVYAEDGNTIADVLLPWALLPNTTYTFNWAGVTDLNGNPATGTTTSSFTTGSSFDFTNTTTTAVTPANGATGVSVNVTPTMTFGEAMNPALITSSQVYLRLHNDTSVTIPATVTVSSSATPATPTTVTVTPTAPLEPSTIYDLLYESNNWYLYDIAGNYDLNGGVWSTFTTGTGVDNGACGAANGGNFSTPPTTNLCSAGTVANLNNSGGSLTWSCNSQDTGTNASCSATVTPANACYPLTSLPTIAGWWKADGTLADASGNGNAGTLENGATYGLGEVNDAFSLSGSNQYVLIGEPVPTVLQLQSNITMQAWIYPTAYPTDLGDGAIGIIAGSQHDGNYAGATMYFDGRVNPDGGGQSGVPAGHIAFNIGDGTTWHIQDTLTQVPLNQWTLITATATSGAAPQIYYNGVLQPSNSGEYPSTWDGTASYSGSWFAIGQEVNENRPFTGLIDEVQIFNSVLTPAQIQGVYNAGNAGVCP